MAKQNRITTPIAKTTPSVNINRATDIPRFRDTFARLVHEAEHGQDETWGVYAAAFWGLDGAASFTAIVREESLLNNDLRNLVCEKKIQADYVLLAQYRPSAPQIDARDILALGQIIGGNRFPSPWGDGERETFFTVNVCDFLIVGDGGQWQSALDFGNLKRSFCPDCGYIQDLAEARPASDAESRRFNMMPLEDIADSHKEYCAWAQRIRDGEEPLAAAV